MVTEAQLRGVLQLPARPFSENILSDGSRYYDLSHFEPLQILSVTGQNGAFNNYQYMQGIDFAMVSGVIDFGIGGLTPTLGIPFKVDYTYSELGASTVSTSMWIASTTVYQQLASTFPYNKISAAGVAYNDLATLGTLMVGAREATAALASSDTINAVKYRRGMVQMDETQKSKNWIELSRSWEAKYQKYLSMIRLSGRLSGIKIIAAGAYSLVFPSDGDAFPEMAYLAEDAYGSYGGVL